MMDYVNAFWVGGLICALAQILLDRTKMMPGRIMVLLVCTRSCAEFSGNLRTVFQICRRRGLRSSDGIRAPVVPGSQGCGG